MTLCVGWIRKINETEEICLAACLSLKKVDSKSTS